MLLGDPEDQLSAGANHKAKRVGCVRPDAGLTKEAADKGAEELPDNGSDKGSDNGNLWRKHDADQATDRRADLDILRTAVERVHLGRETRQFLEGGEARAGQTGGEVVYDIRYSVVVSPISGASSATA